MLLVPAGGGRGKGLFCGRILAGVGGARNLAGGVEYFSLLGGGGIFGGGIGCHVCGGGAAVGVDARADVFAVYGVAGLCFGGRAAALSAVDGFVAVAAGDVCAAGLSVCGKRCFIGLGCTAAGLRQGGGRFGRKRLSDGIPYHAPPLETGVAARPDFGGGNLCGRICGDIVPVASGMADVDDFDLCLFGACG